MPCTVLSSENTAENKKDQKRKKKRDNPYSHGAYIGIGYHEQGNERKKRAGMWVAMRPSIKSDHHAKTWSRYGASRVDTWGKSIAATGNRFIANMQQRL